MNALDIADMAESLGLVLEMEPSSAAAKAGRAHRALLRGLRRCADELAMELGASHPRVLGLRAMGARVHGFPNQRRDDYDRRIRALGREYRAYRSPVE